MFLTAAFIIATIFLIVGICVRRFVTDDGTDPGGFYIFIGLIGYLVVFLISSIFGMVNFAVERYSEEVDAIFSQIYGG